MKNLLILCIIMTINSLNNPALAEKLTIERIFSSPNLSGTPMRNVAFSPDGSRVTFLQGKKEDKDQYDLWEYNIASKDRQMLVDSKVLVPDGEKLSAEEKARRERQRTAGIKGIVEYSWSPQNTALLFPLNGNLFSYNLLSKKVDQLTRSDDFDTDARFSPNGNYVSFIRKQNIYIIELASGNVQQKTFDTEPTLKNGMAEFVAQEEMDRDTGYWWSPDEAHIAYAHVDESPVAITKRYEINADNIEIVEQRYPYTGQPNVNIKLGILNINNNNTTWVDMENEQNIYLSRVKWLPDSQTLSHQIMARNQQYLSLNFSSLDGKTNEILNETSKSWLNLHNDLYFLKDNSFIWASERDGFKHLYQYDSQGKLVKQLTKGDWVVDEINGIDEENNIIYYTSSEKSPVEKQFYSLSMADLSKSQISKKPGWHLIKMDESAQFYIDNYSNREKPESSYLRSANGDLVTILNDNTINKDHPYYPYQSSHQKNTYGILKSVDDHDLHYRMVFPEGFDASKKYPVYHFTYGGPHAQVVTNSWGRRHEIEQFMAQQGFIVFALDNRGSARRGLKFESALYKHMGGVEVDDQLVGVEFLKSLDYVDSDKIGIFGWSYGGFMALKAMTKSKEFAIGVAVAPVTDYELYDTHYTERYMSTPQLNAEGYKTTAVFDDVKNIVSPLLVIHGMADDNVLFTNSTKLFKVMQDEGIMFDSMIYPGAKHGISGNKAQIHVYKTITNYFFKHLK